MSTLERRVFLRDLTLLGVSAAGLAVLGGCGLVPAPTPRKVPRIGYLSVGPRESQADFVDAFLAGLRGLGYVEDQTIVIEWRFNDPLGPANQFQEFADELVHLPVDLIVAGASTPAANAAKQATRTIPILAVAVRDPVATGLVASLAQPGGNLTALSTAVAGFGAKSVEMLRQFVPQMMRVAILVDSSNPTMVLAWEDNRMGAERAGVYAERIDLQSAQDVDAAFEVAASIRPDAVIVDANPLLLPVSARVGALSLKYRLPGSGLKQYVASGLLFDYNPDLAAVHGHAAAYVDRILKGANPADLPVEQPTTYELVVNATTARALGINISPDLAAQVTQWIQ